MDEFRHILELLRKSKRYLEHGIIAAVITCFTGWYYVSQIPSEYTSSSTIYVDPESILDNLLSGISVNRTNIDQEFVAFAYSQLTSRENIRRLVRRIDKDIEAVNPTEMMKFVSQVRSNLVLDLQSKGPSGRERVKYLAIRYSADTPTDARDIVSEASNIFMEAAIGSSSADSTESIEFIEKQVEEYEQRLRKSEDEIETFKRVNFRLMPGSGGNYFDRLNQISSTIRDTELALKESEQRAAQLKLAVNSNWQGPNDSSLILQRIANLQARLDDLQLQYTEHHPDVISTKQQLDLLHSQYKVSGSDIAPNDIALANQTIGLNNADADTAMLRTRLVEYQRRKSELAAAVETIPGVEKQLKQMTRNYDLFKDRRDALVQRREQALMAEEAGLRSVNSKFRVVEPPLLPTSPFV